MAPSLLEKPKKPTLKESSAIQTESKKSGHPNASEIRAGFLVTASLGVLLLLLFTAGNFQFFNPTRHVPIAFNYISGLERNAPVHFAGHQIGKVTDIQFVSEEDTKVVVTASVSPDLILRNDTQAFINVMGFMGEMFVELTPGSPNTRKLQEGERIRGTDPIALMEVVKRGTAIMEEFEKTNASLQRLVTDLDGIIDENETNLNQIFDNLNAASQNLKEMTHDLKVHPWKLLRKSDGRKKRFFFF